MTLNRARLIQVLGLLVTIFGLVGYWTYKEAPSQITEEQAVLIGDTCNEGRPINFVVAGRDILYSRLAGKEIRDANGRVIGREKAARGSALGTNTDTILFVSILCNDINIIAIPRDIWLEDWVTKINSMYYYKGADGLKNAVANIIGLPIDYYAVVNLDIFEDLVDALGGVEVNVPYNMNYDDYAAGLRIHIKEGPQLLDGKQAGGFVRFRRTERGDFDRIDRVKDLASAMLKKMKGSSLATATKIPEIIKAFYKDVETNVDLATLLDLAKNMRNLKIKESVTLPGEYAYVKASDGTEISALAINPREVEKIVANTFGGKAREFAEAPDSVLLITNRSGKKGLAEFYKNRLVAMGIKEDNIITKESSYDPSNSRILDTLDSRAEAEYFVSLFGVEKRQADHLDSRKADIELVLAADAIDTVLGQQFVLAGN